MGHYTHSTPPYTIPTPTSTINPLQIFPPHPPATVLQRSLAGSNADIQLCINIEMISLNTTKKRHPYVCQQTWLHGRDSTSGGKSGGHKHFDGWRIRTQTPTIWTSAISLRIIIGQFAKMTISKIWPRYEVKSSRLETTEVEYIKFSVWNYVSDFYRILFFLICIQNSWRWIEIKEQWVQTNVVSLFDCKFFNL